jgi:hypothetical protein
VSASLQLVPGKEAIVFGQSEELARVGFRAGKFPLLKGAQASGLGGCPGRVCEPGHDNPRAVSTKSLSPFVNGDFDEH